MGQDKRKTGEWPLPPRLRSLDGWKIPQHLYDRLDQAKHELGIPPGVSTEEFALDCMVMGLDLRLRLKIETAAAAAPRGPTAVGAAEERAIMNKERASSPGDAF